MLEVLAVKKLLEPEKLQKGAIVSALGILAVAGVWYVGGKVADSIETTSTSSMDVAVGDAAVLDVRFAPMIDIATVTTEVDAVIVQETLDRAVLPDITEGLASIGTQVTTAICIEPGNKKIRTWTEDSRPHVEMIITGDDVKACSTKTPGVEPMQIYGGSFVQRVNNLDEMAKKLFESSDMKKAVEQQLNSESSRVDLENKQRLSEYAADYAIKMVDEKCMPVVFNASKDELIQSLSEASAREGEVFSVVFEEGIENAYMSTQSDATQRIAQRTPRKEADGSEWKMEGATVNMGECTLAPEVLGKAKEQQDNNRGKTDTPQAMVRSDANVAQKAEY